MEKNQKEVVRRKRVLLAKLLDFSKESQILYKEVGLMNVSQQELILVSFIPVLDTTYPESHSTKTFIGEQ